MEITSLTITQAHQRLMKKEFSALDLCQAHLDKIKKRDKEIFAFLTISEDLALSQAKKVDDLILDKKEVSILAGIPLAIKDNILVKDVRCTAGSKILENYIAPYNATVIEKLKNQQVVILGKTNMDEFAMGVSGENSAFEVTKNPLDLTRVPGGSSSGSAAAVAAEMAVCALGSDTGGSVRQPASFCGKVGLKPTYGSVSRYGLIAFASSLDQIGPITKTVEDAEIVFNVIKGRDKLDSTSMEPKLKVGKGKLKINELRIGIPKEYFACPVGSRRDSYGVKGIDPDIEKIIKAAIKRYEEMGAQIREVSLPHTEYALPAYYIINPSEASANLARYDGIRFGFSEKSKSLSEVYFKSRGQGFGPEVKRRIMLGTYALSAGYYDAYYLRAQKVRTLVRNDFEKVFKQVDVLMAPVSPVLPFKIGEKIDDPLSMYLLDVYTASINLVGLPALSLPVGKVGELSVGLQIIGKPFEEDKIFEIGNFFEMS